MKSCRAILDLAHRNNVEMPITEVVTAVIAGRTTIQEATSLLLTRTPEPEHYGIRQ
ncbi:oxidoreductase subunit [Streptomyces sp. NPDC096311]|uniref:oxidoreductase subunit n=1 Tax=Streptomyces sp. NPDC096311 TaxID=3366083 RepID=UPI00382755A0